MPHYYKNIKGAFNFESLYYTIVDDAENNSKFLEIGTWLGKSTCYMAECIKESQKNIEFHVVDTFIGTVGEGSYLEGDSFHDQFIYNMKSANVDDLIVIHQGKSDECLSEFEDESLDFIYIDGDHSYESVVSDITGYLTKLKPGKILAGHDYQCLDVKNAVDELLGIDNLTFHLNTWIYRKNA